MIATRSHTDHQSRLDWWRLVLPYAYEFCERRGLSIHTFRKRLYAGRASEAARQDEPLPLVHTSPFLPVNVLPDPSPAFGATQPALELVLRNGRRIAVAPGFDPETLRRLLTVAEDVPCSD